MDESDLARLAYALVVREAACSEQFGTIGDIVVESNV